MTRRSVVVLVFLVAAAAPFPVSPRDGAAQAAGRGWLALGDSYSSGEGIPGTLAREAEGSGVATQGRDCRRATGEDTGAAAWSVGAYREIAGELGFDEIALVACTGAMSSELEGQIGEARARFGRGRWDVVTFSVGGNDVRFAEVLKGCLDVNSAWGAFDLTPGCDFSEAELRHRIDDLRASLAGVYDTVAQVVSPGGDVVVVGYPHLVEEVARWDGWRRTLIRNCEGIQSYDVGMLRSVTGYLNQQIALAAQDADARQGDRGVRFHFLDISRDPYEYSGNATDRHALCSADPWLNGLTVGITSGDWWELGRSFHPNQTGHTKTARVLAAFVRSNVSFDDIPPPLLAPFAGSWGIHGGTISITSDGAVTITWWINEPLKHPPVSGYVEIDLQINATSGWTATAVVTERSVPAGVDPTAGPGSGPNLQVGDTYTLTLKSPGIVGTRPQGETSWCDVDHYGACGA
ncbi:MAG: hypothetical protein WD271_17750 [Acidimicrobiia bacterium]